MHDTDLIAPACTSHSGATSAGPTSAALISATLTSTALALTILLLFGSSTARPDETRPAVDPSSETPGSGFLELHDGDSSFDALLLDTDFKLDVHGLLAELTLVQTFRNTTDHWLDGRYLFPLPEQASVHGLALRVGERLVSGRVMKRAAAEAEFDQARASGKVAGLIEQQRPNLFTARVASIPPGAALQVRLSILLPVHVDDRKLSLTLPTTLTPRYANAARPAPEITAAPILPKEFIRGPRLNLTAVIGPGLDRDEISSPSHQLAVIDGTISLNGVTMDRDVVLEWPFPTAVMKGGIADAVVVATHKGVSYTQVLMAPPATRPDDLRPFRELVLVIDTSGSMAGDAIDAAREAALNALDGLQPGDHFEVIEFDDRTRSLFGSPAEADERNLRVARRFIQRLEADGGTEMAPALARALAHEGDDTAATTVRQVVFLTDGSITDERALLQQISRDIGTKRLFTVGIGQAPNAWFLHKAASIGGGTALTVRDVDAVRDTVSDLFGRLAEPVLSDIRVHFPDGSEAYPTRIPDLYADSPLMVVARLPDDDDTRADTMIITGQQGDKPFRREVALPLNEPAVTPTLGMYWARQKVSSLLDEQRMSGDDDHRHEDTITTLALDVGLVTPYTSFVAVENRVTRDTAAAQAVAVPNVMPAGNTMLAIVIPQGAAGIHTLAWLGALAGFLGAFFMRLGRRSRLSSAR